MIITLFIILDAYTSINIDTISLDLTQRNFSKAITGHYETLLKILCGIVIIFISQEELSCMVLKDVAYE